MFIPAFAIDPGFAMDQDWLLDLSGLSSDAQRREAWAKKLKRAQEIRRVAEQEHIAYMKQRDAEWDEWLFLKKMRDIEDDFFLIFLMVSAAPRRASSHQQEQPLARHVPQSINTSKPFRTPPPI